MAAWAQAVSHVAPVLFGLAPMLVGLWWVISLPVPLAVIARLNLTLLSVAFIASDVCAKGNYKLVQAAGAGYTDEVRKLVRCPGVDVNHIDSSNWTALLHASYNDNLHVVTILLNDTRTKVNQAKMKQLSLLQQSKTTQL